MTDIILESNSVKLTGSVTKNTVPDLVNKINTVKSWEAFQIINVVNIDYIDSAGVSFLDTIYDNICNSGSKPTFSKSIPQVSNAISTFSSVNVRKEPKPIKIKFLELLGERGFSSIYSFFNLILLTSDIFYWSTVGIYNKKSSKKGSFSQQAILLGVEAVPIISLLSLIIGLILALQAAAQLRQFGANIFVADLISISMVREMGPMMTAIIVAGRSGSSIASEIATMKVTEELDALKMMALNPIRYIVVPKFHAISLCMPLLVVISIFVGVFGGLIIAVTYLDLSVTSYVNEAIKILEIKDVVVSLVKSLFFSWVIVIIGSYYGFQVTGGAEGVGRATTQSVVASIFAVIVFDALFSLIFLPS